MIQDRNCLQHMIDMVEDLVQMSTHGGNSQLWSYRSRS
jgi:hypothetical protein